MKILLLSDLSSSHTIKWANALTATGIEIILFGFNKYDKTQFSDSIQIFSLNTPEFIASKLNGNFLKFYYIKALPKLFGILRQIKPDILHAHYVASYGLVGALSHFHPMITSVWGIDILKFPNYSSLHKRLVEFALKKSDYVFATSEYLKTHTQLYTDKLISLTPFGVNTNIFKPDSTCQNGDEIVIGTIKNLENKYGIDFLIKVFAELKFRIPNVKLKLLIVGGGSLRSNLEKLAEELSIRDYVEFTGHIPHNRIAAYHNKIDIACYFSNVESFGVSVLESSACEKPVVVSDVGGLPEVVQKNQTGFVVNSCDIKMAVDAIKKLILDKQLRLHFGKEGRNMVKNLFEEKDCVNRMINLYNDILKSDKNVNQKNSGY